MSVHLGVRKMVIFNKQHKITNPSIKRANNKAAEAVVIVQTT